MMPLDDEEWTVRTESLVPAIRCCDFEELFQTTLAFLCACRMPVVSWWGSFFFPRASKCDEVTKWKSDVAQLFFFYLFVTPALATTTSCT